jgi:flavin reductase (DIM6/NTAB) family NADH-FMN oxidoreductase RutF|tara:strand:+ start:784 stop:948 length:165 start_codon:yes stop_codon:yes gene_type:complete
MVLGWLVGATLASFAGAVLTVKVVKAVVGETHDAIEGAVFRFRMGDDHDENGNG